MRRRPRILLDTDKTWIPGHKLRQIDLTADGVNTGNSRVQPDREKKGLARIISFNRRRKQHKKRKKKDLSRSFSVAGRRSHRNRNR